MIDSLIDKQDGFEIVRDKLADILKMEIANQQVLALAAGEDPDLWRVDIYLERSNAWEKWLNKHSDPTPICNVSCDSAIYNKGASNKSERQKSETIFNLDCYGFGLSADDGGTGHTPGDREAALESQRAFKLIRNIIMSAEYTYLQLRADPVWGRWPQSWRSLQPEFNGQAIQNVNAVRFSLQVDHNEFAPQYTPVDNLEWLTVTTYRAEDGEILVRSDFIEGLPLVERNTYQALMDRTTEKPLVVREEE